MRRTQLMTYPNRWTVGEWTFYQIEGHGFSGIDGPLYGFERDGDRQRDHRGAPKLHELYETLDEAMVAAVGEKYTGRRGAGGTAVGTAADWFMTMIGARENSKVYERPKPPADTSAIQVERVSPY